MSVFPNSSLRDPLKADRVYQSLRDRIRTLKIAPGAPLKKEEIAAEFGVSRAPVNDAIARLAEEGLVDVFPQHGSFVARLSAEDVREALFIRAALEVEVMRQATVLRDAVLIAELRENVQDQEKALEQGDLVKLYQLDEALHDAIFNAVSVARANKILEAARAPLDRMRQMVLPSKGRPEVTVREHKMIVEAIASGDPEFAGRAMRLHLNGLRAVVEEQLKSLEEQQP
jgi:GntR family transcriptional regulator, rspAB operon transcriptional repressor